MTSDIAPSAVNVIAPSVLEELWQTCEAWLLELSRNEFEQIVAHIGAARNFGLPGAQRAGMPEQAAFFSTLRIADLVLARACAVGKERAWERFVELYRQPLLRAGVAITGNESLGRELADGLYAELYGLTAPDGKRRCPLDSYMGRGSLLGWLRTTMAQRHVDHYRRTHREQPLELAPETGDSARSVSEPVANVPLTLLASAVNEAVEAQPVEDRFVLGAYYLDGRRLHEISALLSVHEATVSRRLKRAIINVRKQILRALERKGLSRQAAEEALGADPRDLTGTIDSTSDRGHLRLKELLQRSTPQTFKEQAER